MINKTTTSQNQNYFACIPNELLVNFFTFLDPNSYASCSTVCTSWQKVLKIDCLRKAIFSLIYGEAITSTLGTFFPSRRIDWFPPSKLAELYGYLDRLTENILHQHVSSSDKQLTTDAPKPSAQTGPWQFFLRNRWTIEFVDPFSLKTYVIKSKKPLSHLGCNYKHSLFALRCDGKIEEYNYITKDHVKTHETLYSKKDEFIARNNQNEPITHRYGFVVNEESIFLIHRTSENGSCCELLSTHTSMSSIILTSHDPDTYISSVINDRLAIFTDERLIVYDLQLKKIIFVEVLLNLPHTIEVVDRVIFNPQNPKLLCFAKEKIRFVKNKIYTGSMNLEENFQTLHFFRNRLVGLLPYKVDLKTLYDLLIWKIPSDSPSKFFASEKMSSKPLFRIKDVINPEGTWKIEVLEYLTSIWSFLIKNPRKASSKVR